MVHRVRAFALAISLTGLLGGPALAVDAASVTSEVLLKTGSSWDGVAYERYPAGPPEVTVLRITIPPKTELAWHTHPMPNAAYVLSGGLTVEKRDGGLTKQLKAGDVLPEMVNTVHRGRTGDEPVVLIVFYAGARGQPLSETVK